MLYPPLSHDEFVARLLIDIWTLATGRTLRCDVPPHELTTEELIDFWADDLLDAEATLPRIRHGLREAQHAARRSASPDLKRQVEA